MTAIYHIRRQHDNDLNDLPLTSSSAATMKFSLVNNEKEKKNKSNEERSRSVHIENDV